jgi:hypothetical protein
MIVNCVVSTVTMTEKDKERNGCNVKGLRWKMKYIIQDNHPPGSYSKA